MSPEATFPLWVQAGAALIVSAAVVAVYRNWALRNRVLDRPNARSAHRVPIPRGGGVGIVAAVMAGSAYRLAVGGGAPAPVLEGYLLAAAIVAGVSLADDLKGLPALLRLAAHVLAGAIFLVGARLSGLLREAPAGASLLWLLLLGIWIPAWANAFNFMDGIDGIAGLQGIIVGAGWAWLGLPGCAAGMGGMLAGGCAGFLLFNWPPARIFMGDVGSAFVGFTVSALPILAALAPGSRLPLDRSLAWTLALGWPFAFDTAVTLLRRWRRGENLLQSHASHLYQGLVKSGLSHRTVALLYAGLAGGGAVAAALWMRGLAPAWLFPATIAVLAGALVRLTYLRNRY